MRYLREEWRLMRADNWQGEDMGQPPAFRPCSSEDPRCAETIARLANCRARMKQMRSGLLDDPNRAFTNSASTDVAATMRRARSMTVGPVRAFPAKRIAR
jgi:hypothetical protein